MSVLPARIALMGQDESWGAISAAVFRANFQHDLDIQAEDVVHDLLRDGAGRGRADRARQDRGCQESLRRRSTAPAIWACSVRPPSSSATRCSGATTGSRMRWSGRSRALRPPAPRPASPRRPEAVQPLDGRATREQGRLHRFFPPLQPSNEELQQSLARRAMPGGRSFTNSAPRASVASRSSGSSPGPPMPCRRASRGGRQLIGPDSLFHGCAIGLERSRNRFSAPAHRRHVRPFLVRVQPRAQQEAPALGAVQRRRRRGRARRR